MPSLPTGTVTFLFTDIEGSTRLLQRLGDRYAQVLADFRQLLQSACEERGGREVDTQGDGVFIAFPRAREAVAAAASAQRALAAHAWPEGASVRVRMGLHTGEPRSAETEYVGLDVHRAARICAAGHGGQILLSEATRTLVADDLPEGVSLKDLGEHRLKDLAKPLRLYQVTTAGLPAHFPPLQSLEVLRKKRRQWALAGVGTLVVYLVVLLGVNVGSWQDKLLRRAGVPVIRSLVVLPLANLSGEREEYLADGMTDELISDLAKIRALRVISRTSAMQYKSAKKSLSQIAQELDVDAAVEGSVLRVGDRVRINVQLTAVNPERHLWAKPFDGNLRDVLALHREVALAIAEEVRVTLTPQEKVAFATTRPVNPEAHTAYLRGRYLLNKAASEKEIGVAIAEFQRALAKDPAYALAYAGLSDAHYTLADTYLAPTATMPQARAAALKALDLDESLAEAHVSLANVYFVYDWAWKRAEKESRRAIELNPNLATAYDIQGNNFISLGRYPEAVAAFKRALVLDPLSIGVYSDAGWMYFLGREYDQSIEQFNKALGLEDYPLARAQLALAYAGKGQYAQAIAEARKAEKADSPLVVAIVAGVYATSGERANAEKVLNRLLEVAKTRYVCPYEVATAYLALGDKEQAFQWLERAYQARSACMPFLKMDPRFDPIRSDQRFTDLVRRVGFPP